MQVAVMSFLTVAQHYALSASADKSAQFATTKSALISWVKSATVMTIGVSLQLLSVPRAMNCNVSSPQTLIRAEDLDYPGTNLTPDAMSKILGNAIAALDKQAK